MQILRKEAQLNDVKAEAIDSEVLVDFGINMIRNASKLWKTLGLTGRRRLQSAIFPEGLIYDFEKGFRTAKTSELYEVIEQVAEKSSNVVQRYIRGQNFNSWCLATVGMEPV